MHRYAIIDIETTGLSPKNARITEVAIILHDGQKETHRFSSLINPECNIPYAITRLTGINKQMVATAPKFYELAKTIIELTENRTLVGHNINFDYRFLQAAFAEYRYTYRRPTLCTVKLSRKAFPRLPSYSLSKICAHLGIENKKAHRAMGDAEAALQLFELIAKQNPELISAPAKQLPKALPEEKIKALPDEAGVYYFLNAMGEVIYVGKSKHIRQRIHTHLNNNDTIKAVDMRAHIADIRYTLTGSELIALLLESEEIKRLKPLYNRAQIHSVFSHGLFLKINDEGYYELYKKRIESLDSPITTFKSAREATDFIHLLAEENSLCHHLCGLSRGAGPCFSYQIHRCQGACIGKESPANYNKKVQEAIETLQFNNKDFFLIEKGRSTKEKGIIQVSGGAYYGFGYLADKQALSIENLQKCIEARPSNRDSNNIILRWIRNKSYRMIALTK